MTKWKPVSNGIYAYAGDGTTYIGAAWTPFEAGKICTAHNAGLGVWSAVPPMVDAWWWYDAIQRRLKAYDRCRALAEETKK